VYISFFIKILEHIIKEIIIFSTQGLTPVVIVPWVSLLWIYSPAGDEAKKKGRKNEKER
jgi:hypothetical protein